MAITIKANYVDIPNRKIYAAEIIFKHGKVHSITAINEPVSHYILPGFVDAHIHIESSMLAPSAFAPIAVQHGTVATISDPHEIANVCGVPGVQYMIDNAKQVPLKFHFGAPSCVPALPLEAAGAVLDSNAVAELLATKDIYYLSEVMNYPGVLFKDEEVMKKINWAKHYNKPIDGHAPGLMGNDAINYINAGISTDHECYTKAEALHKLQHGMKVLIREGSAAKNFEALHELIPVHYNNLMFCCDDKHPDELLLHHINHHVQRAVAKGYNVFDVLQMACINPVKHYNMEVGLLQIGDAADAIIVQDLINFKVLSTYINGYAAFENNKVLFNKVEPSIINNFNCTAKKIADFTVPYTGQTKIKVIEALDGQLITNKLLLEPKVADNTIVADTKNDVLQIAVINRYTDAPVANGFIKNFGLQHGAIASTVGHDCHNIIVVGTSATAICNAANALIESKGGIAVITASNKALVMPLPIAGIMTNATAEEAGSQYQQLDAAAKQLGCTLTAPFMTLSFMALPVIPALKMCDKGLFDSEVFDIVEL
jgi:adenine deaminase